MRYFTVLLLLFACTFAFPACAQKATSKTSGKKISKKAAAKQRVSPAKPTVATTTPTAPAATDSEPIVTFERTPCFGTCPAYSMRVFADGRVVYEGRRLMPMMGEKTLQLPVAALADLLRTAKEAHFEEFKDKYSSGATDMPSTIIGVRQPGTPLKTVTMENGAAENVQTLFNYFANQFDALAQLRADK